MVRAVNVFVSYSHEDEPLRIELEKHLSSLRRSQAIAEWHDRKIEPGTEWAKEIDLHLRSADVILLLISPAFIHSEYCSTVELTQAMARHEAGAACVIPIILRPSDWENEPFAKLQAYPKNAKPVTTWENRDEAFLDIVRGIRAAVKCIAEQLTEVATEIERETEAIAVQIIASGQGEEQYSDEVLFCLKQDIGEISPESRIVLEVSRSSLKLSLERANEIEAEVARPFQEFYKAAIELIKSPTIPPKIQTLLNRVQQTVNLSNEDAIAIVNRVLSTVQPVKVEISELPALSQFDFEITTLNDQGEICDRRSSQASYFRETLAEGIFLDMVMIPSGNFWMGAAEGEIGASLHEIPQHQVTIASFFMGKFAVTEAQWNEVVRLPKINRTIKAETSMLNNQPIRNVSWEDAIEFCDRLSKKTGKQYRLPSEAEWEYACRAGTTTPFYFGKTITSEWVNYNGNDGYANAPKGLYREKAIEVGSLPPNAFGLYEMHGNVREWCADPWHDHYENAPIDGQVWEIDRDDYRRVLRGGSWLDLPRDCRSASRNFVVARFRSYFFGFRVACLIH